MNNCAFCQKETTNPKFCSRSCSTSFNNLLTPKRKREKKCRKCGTPICTSHVHCENCMHKMVDYTLSEAIYENHHRSSAFALVRTRARKVAKELGYSACKNCGYDKHIEVCHIKPINSFPLDTKLSVINSPSNLLPLCPNCHWEHDNL